jgi:hypothetical protein
MDGKNGEGDFMVISELISELEKTLKKEGDIKVILCAIFLEEITYERWALSLMGTHVETMDWCGKDEKYFVVSATV